jgi:hypothetical protein
MTPITDELSRRSLLLGIAACAVLLGVAAGASIYFERHHESVPTSPDAANAELQTIRARFAGQAPMLDMASREGALPPAAAAEPIHAFHTVIYDTHGSRRLVHMTAPIAFARLFAHRDGWFRWLGELTFLDDTEFDPEPIHLSFEAIRRRGPGLLVDYRHPGGGQFIAWVE